MCISRHVPDAYQRSVNEPCPVSGLLSHHFCSQNLPTVSFPGRTLSVRCYSQTIDIHFESRKEILIIHVFSYGFYRSTFNWSTIRWQKYSSWGTQWKYSFIEYARHELAGSWKTAWYCKKYWYLQSNILSTKTKAKARTRTKVSFVANRKTLKNPEVLIVKLVN